ncbi:MAG: hypothetical protein ACC645_02965, partial [Pirellulales bacterium]
MADHFHEILAFRLAFQRNGFDVLIGCGPINLQASGVVQEQIEVPQPVIELDGNPVPVDARFQRFDFEPIDVRIALDGQTGPGLASLDLLQVVGGCATVVWLERLTLIGLRGRDDQTVVGITGPLPARVTAGD